jgi:2-keto-3-deoxy-L-fuconate dehydrogenase
VGSLENTSEADFDRVMTVNVKGAFLCAKAGVRHFLAGGGGVMVNMSSIAAVIGVPDRLAYSSSKGAIHAMTYSIAVDYMKKNIRCNSIVPARIHTPFVDGFVAKNYPGREAEMLQKLHEYQPIGRMGKPSEVATMALYLASDESSFITGRAFPIDGGVLVT